MGLMQVMPETYDGLRGRYSLGDDPFDPHNNILAGTAYLREMYDRFGAPGFLAAYNAGPNRLDRYLNSGAPLPDETVNYVASIAPLLGPETPMSGPLAVYAGGAAITRVASRRTRSGCDPDAAYNPEGPCPPLAPVRAAPFVAQTASAPPPAYSMTDCNPDAAYDPTRPCRSAAPLMLRKLRRRRVATAPPIAIRMRPMTRRGPVDRPRLPSSRKPRRRPLSSPNPSNLYGARRRRGRPRAILRRAGPSRRGWRKRWPSRPAHRPLRPAAAG